MGPGASALELELHPPPLPLCPRVEQLHTALRGCLQRSGQSSEWLFEKQSRKTGRCSHPLGAQPAPNVLGMLAGMPSLKPLPCQAGEGNSIGIPGPGRQENQERG